MNRIWLYLTLAAAAFSIVNGRAGAANAAMMDAGHDAVSLTISLLGTMTLWSGMMEILSEAGDLQRLARAMRRILKGLFGGVQDDACWEAMGMNLAANILGLGNAATPAGVRTAQLLAGQGECGLRALAMLLALNNAGLQLIPTTVISLRQSYGAAAPTDVWLPSLAASAVSATVSAAVLLVVQRREARECRKRC